MNNRQRIKVLRPLLLIKWIATLLVFGLPALVGPPELINFFSLAYPQDPTFLRVLGAIITAVALAYFYAWQDPVANRAILKFGIVENGLAALTIAYLFIIGGVSSWFLWLGFLFGVFYFIAISAFLPEKEQID